MAKGDWIKVHIRGLAYPIEVLASKAGRKLEVESSKEQGLAWILVHEKTWTNKNVKTTRFAAGDVLAVESNFTEEE